VPPQRLRCTGIVPRFTRLAINVRANRPSPFRVRTGALRGQALPRCR
jgi:hypothetical protein